MNLREELYRIRKMMGLNERVYTDDELIAIAKKSKTPKEFRYKNRKAADQAYQKGLEFWNMVTSHMKKQPQKYFCENPEKIYEDALNYDYIPEFNKNSTLRKAAIKCGIFDEVTKHMKKLGSLTKRLVYAFEFPDNSVYVGLTHNMDKREKQHEDRGSVSEHFAKTKEKPTLKIISDEYIDAFDAQKMEECTVELYKNNGWKILNKSKTGSLGACKVTWSKDAVRNLAKTLSTYKQFQLHSGAYGAAQRNGWLKDTSIVGHLQRKAEYGSKGDLERIRRIFNDAIQYESFYDFHYKEKGKVRPIYTTAKEDKLLDDIKKYYLDGTLPDYISQ
jgi:predicted GIY-YIG superfamily endonuclease